MLHPLSEDCGVTSRDQLWNLQFDNPVISASTPSTPSRGYRTREWRKAHNAISRADIVTTHSCASTDDAPEEELQRYTRKERER